MNFIKYTFISFFALSFNFLLAQPFSELDQVSTIEIAEEFEAENSIYTALSLYEQLYKENPTNEVALKLATLNYDLRDYRKAASYFSRLLKKDKKGELKDYYYELGKSLKYQGKNEEAYEAFLMIMDSDSPKKSLAKMEIEGIKGISKLDDLPKSITIENAGNLINSKNADFGPFYDDESGMLYFSSMKANKLVDDSFKDESNARIFKTKKGAKGWMKPEVLGLVNRPGYHTGSPAKDPSGNYLFFTRAITGMDKLSESKLFFSKKEGNDWSGAKEVANVNGDYMVKHPAFGEMFGKTVLFFTSNKPGTVGGDDIFYANFNEDGTLGNVVPLSTVINTVGNEVTPYYTNGTLYFSTDGRPTMGGFDIFKSKWNGTGWTTPENIGKGYNSPVDDLFYRMDDQSFTGFLVSNREGTKSVKSPTCCDDIWVIEKAPILVTALIKAYNKDKKGMRNVSIDIVEMDGIATVDEINKNTEKGNKVTMDRLNLERKYMIIGSKEGYKSDTVYVSTLGIKESQNMTSKLYLEKIAPPAPPVVKKPEPEFETYSTNETIRLNKIYYDFDDDKILFDAEKDLTILFELMNEYPTMVIELSSHTDSQGNDGYNKKLSQRRANSAKMWLVNKGIVSDRIKAVGYGESLILNECTNGVECEDDQHRFNRRTEFKIISGPTTIKIDKKRLKQ